MFYMMYLTNLCERRHWPDPHFETRHDRRGWTCRVRVNHREYSTDNVYDSEDLARHKAAESAYMICRNFSLNDGMIPGQKQGQAGVTQGLPVAIGTGRQTSASAKTVGQGVHASVMQVQNPYGVYQQRPSSGDSSPHSSEGEFDSRRSSGHVSAMGMSSDLCPCRRAYVYMHQRCQYCLHEHGWRC